LNSLQHKVSKVLPQHLERRSELQVLDLLSLGSLRRFVMKYVLPRQQTSKNAPHGAFFISTYQKHPNKTSLVSFVLFRIGQFDRFTKN